MLEILASKIRNDDCTNLLRNAKSMKKLLKLISEFSEVAGPKPNLKKLNVY